MTERKKTLMWTNIRYGIYSGLAFLTALSIIVPTTKYACALIILGYILYTVSSTFQFFTQVENSSLNKNKAIRKALAANSLDIALLVIAITVGFIVGLGA